MSTSGHSDAILNLAHGLQEEVFIQCSLYCDCESALLSLALGYVNHTHRCGCACACSTWTCRRASCRRWDTLCVLWDCPCRPKPPFACSSTAATARQKYSKFGNVGLRLHQENQDQISMTAIDGFHNSQGDSHLPQPLLD